MNRNEIYQPAEAEMIMRYGISNTVRKLKRTKYGWSAVVCDGEDYEVDICMKDGSVENMDCSCPSSADGSYCVHMSAVLSAIRDNDIQETDSPVSLTDILDLLDEETLRKELGSCLEHSEEEKEVFFRRYGSLSGSSGILAEFREKLENLRDLYGDRFGCVNAKNAAAFTDAVTDCLYDTVSPLLEKRKNMTAFRMINEAFRLINTFEMEGSYSALAAVIESMWLSVYYQCSAQEEEKMYDWFSRMHHAEQNLILSEIIDSVYLNVFD